jgi:hypothetical protein
MLKAFYVETHVNETVGAALKVLLSNQKVIAFTYVCYLFFSLSEPTPKLIQR